MRCALFLPLSSHSTSHLITLLHLFSCGRIPSQLLLGVTPTTAHHRHNDDVHTPRYQRHEKDGEHTKAMVAPDNSDCPLVAVVGDGGWGLLLIAVVHDGGVLSGELFLSGGKQRDHEGDRTRTGD